MKNWTVTKVRTYFQLDSLILVFCFPDSNNLSQPFYCCINDVVAAVFRWGAFIHKCAIFEQGRLFGQLLSICDWCE